MRHVSTAGVGYCLTDAGINKHGCVPEAPAPTHVCIKSRPSVFWGEEAVGVHCDVQDARDLKARIHVDAGDWTEEIVQTGLQFWQLQGMLFAPAVPLHTSVMFSKPMLFR